jgi:hypothetical protein
MPNDSGIGLVARGLAGRRQSQLEGRRFYDREIVEEIFDRGLGSWLKLCRFYYWRCSSVGVKQAKQYL